MVYIDISLPHRVISKSIAKQMRTIRRLDFYRRHYSVSAEFGGALSNSIFLTFPLLLLHVLFNRPPSPPSRIRVLKTSDPRWGASRRFSIPGGSRKIVWKSAFLDEREIFILTTFAGKSREKKRNQTADQREKIDEA